MSFFFLPAENLSKSQKIIAFDTQRHLDGYAKEGLRTLCIAKKVRNSSHPNIVSPEEQDVCFILFIFLYCGRLWVKTSTEVG